MHAHILPCVEMLCASGHVYSCQRLEEASASTCFVIEFYMNLKGSISQSTVYIGIAMVFPPYIRKFSSCFQFQTSDDFTA